MKATTTPPITANQQELFTSGLDQLQVRNVDFLAVFPGPGGHQPGP